MLFDKTFCLLALVVSAVRAAEVHGESAKKEMGPVAFLWPSDRAWDAASDNTAPCGSSSGVSTNRTAFPLMHGSIALVAQDEGWNISVGISYNNNPTSNDDFTTLISSTVAEMDPGHMCLSVPDTTRRVLAGDNATIQIQLTSDFEDNKNETYYACADITYVEVASFDTQIPCFNVSTSDFVTSSFDTTTTTGKDKNKGLNKGQISGICVGTIVGVVAIVGAGIFFWLRKKRTQSSESSEPEVVEIEKAVVHKKSFMSDSSSGASTV